VPLDAICGSAGAFLRERLLETPGPEDALTLMEDFLIGQMADDARPDPAVVAAAGALARGSRVAEVADRLGLLPRTLRRRFTAPIGLTPKRFGRVQRLQRLVRGLDGQARVDWAATAARHGYCDQAHLADEFRELVGVTPAGYLRSRVNGPNHLRFDVRA
jgi:transcriptional regulator GlxA family with amidase domain